MSGIEQSPIAARYDVWGIYLQHEERELGKVSWHEIDLVAIRIEDEFLPFPYWYIGNKANLLRFPNDAKGGKELFFDGLGEHIPGYKCDSTYKTIIAASSALEGSFIVWKSANAESA